MSQQLPPEFHWQGFDAAVEADEARLGARGVQLRTDESLTPRSLTLRFWLD
jgi:hypothetical protein